MTDAESEALHEPPPASRRARVALFAAALVVVALAAATVSWWNEGKGTDTPDGIHMVFAAQADTLARAPEGVRVRVRVVNTTSINGLAKRATSVLRDHGFDVVEYEGDKRKPRATTLVQTHTGHSDWSDRVLRVLGSGTIEPSTDSSHYVDITVLLGHDWKAPAQAFRP